MSVSFETRIESYDVQPNDLIRPSTLFKLFQKAGCDDLDHFGMSYDYLRENGIVFVLTKMTVQYFKDIHSYDNVLVKTCPRGYRGASFIRDFDVRVNGERAIYATSTWAIMNINTRRILRPHTIDELGHIVIDTEDMLELPDRRMHFDVSSLKRTDVRTVRYAQIDRNNHMNNTFYPDVVYDYFPDELKNSDVGHLMSVYYSSEIVCGQKYDIYTQLNGQEFIFVAKNPENKKDIFSAVIDF